MHSFDCEKKKEGSYLLKLAVTLFNFPKVSLMIEAKIHFCTHDKHIFESKFYNL